MAGTFCTELTSQPTGQLTVSAKTALAEERSQRLHVYLQLKTIQEVHEVPATKEESYRPE